MYKALFSNFVAFEDREADNFVSMLIRFELLRKELQN